MIFNAKSIEDFYLIFAFFNHMAGNRNSTISRSYETIGDTCIYIYISLITLRDISIAVAFCHILTILSYSIQSICLLEQGKLHCDKI